MRFPKLHLKCWDQFEDSKIWQWHWAPPSKICGWSWDVGFHQRSEVPAVAPPVSLGSLDEGLIPGKKYGSQKRIFLGYMLTSARKYMIWICIYIYILHIIMYIHCIYIFIYLFIYYCYIFVCKKDEQLACISWSRPRPRILGESSSHQQPHR